MTIVIYGKMGDSDEEIIITPQMYPDYNGISSKYIKKFCTRLYVLRCMEFWNCMMYGSECYKCGVIQERYGCVCSYYEFMDCDLIVSFDHVYDNVCKLEKNSTIDYDFKESLDSLSEHYTDSGMRDVRYRFELDQPWKIELTMVDLWIKTINSYFWKDHIERQKYREKVHKISVAKNIPEELERGILEFLT